MSKSLFTAVFPARAAEQDGAGRVSVARQLMEELAARTIPPCCSARYRWVKVTLSASAADGAAVAGQPGARRVARTEQPTIARRSRGPGELRMTGGALSGEKVLDQRTSGAFGVLRIDGNLQIT